MATINVVIKYRDTVTLDVDGEDVSLPAVDQERLTRFQRSRPGTWSVRLLFGTVDQKKLAALIEIAKRRNEERGSHAAYAAPNFFNYVLVTYTTADSDPDHGMEQAVETAKKLVSVFPPSDKIDHSYIRLSDRPAGLTPAVNPPTLERGKPAVHVHHKHLHPAPVGLGVSGIWKYKGGDGSGQTLFDIELGWYLAHEDMCDVAATAKSGVYTSRVVLNDANLPSSPDDLKHGTEVLGLVCANYNPDRGSIGVAPNTTNIKAVTNWSSSGAQLTGAALLNAATDQLTGAVNRAKSTLDINAVILIEVQAELVGQSYLFPVEVYSETFEAIRLATEAGISVVEPAGNGADLYASAPTAASGQTAVPSPSAAQASSSPPAMDLDLLVQYIVPTDGLPPIHLLGRTQSLAVAATPNRIEMQAFRDSGAIIVASGRSTSYAPASVKWVRDFDSNFGSRIDCFAQGRNTHTLTYNPGRLGEKDINHSAFTTRFSGTSAASAIIAGAALCLKGVAQNANPSITLDASQVRKILSDGVLGTKILGGATDEIGVMPNLAAIVADAADTWAK